MSHFLKSFLVAASLTLASVSSEAAVIGNAQIGDSFNSTIYKTPGTGNFIDTIVFNLSGSADVTYSISEFEFGSFINIDFLGFGFYDASNNLLLDTSALVAGIYTLNIIGNVVGSAGGAYNLAYAVTATPVPEAETFAMFLAGLGLVGSIVVRRKFNIAA